MMYDVIVELPLIKMSSLLLYVVLRGASHASFTDGRVPSLLRSAIDDEKVHRKKMITDGKKERDMLQLMRSVSDCSMSLLLDYRIFHSETNHVIKYLITYHIVSDCSQEKYLSLIHI